MYTIHINFDKPLESASKNILETNELNDTVYEPCWLSTDEYTWNEILVAT